MKFTGKKKTEDKSSAVKATHRNSFENTLYADFKDVS